MDVEEYYHGVEFAAALDADALARLPSRVVAQTERLLDLLDAHGARATFFTLGVVAQRYPRLVRSLVARGPRAGLARLGPHAGVRARPRGLPRRRAARRAARWRPPAATRCAAIARPNYSIRPDMPWAFSILAEEGHAYDSSVHPITHDRYGFPGAPRFAHRLPGDSGLWEVPVGTARALGTNLPLGGGFFRLFPGALLEGAIASVNRRERQPLVLYVHPWEFDPRQPRPAMPWSHRFRHYVGLAGAERKLRALLAGVPVHHHRGTRWRRSASRRPSPSPARPRDPACAS